MTTPTSASGDSNLDNIIKKNFPTEIQQRRVKLELKYLKELDQNCYKISLQSSPLGLKIIVSLTKDFILGQLPESKKFQHPIMFEFLLEPKFPFVFPKLLCKTNITTPSFADGRDFVYDVIQRMWNPSIMLRDVVTFIPDFLKKIDELAVPEETQTMGSYYLGHLYNLEDFLSMDAVQVFSAKEMINEQSTNNERFLVLSESYFLNFESVDKVRNTLRLIGWAHVHSIFKIKRNKDDHKMIVVLWRDFNNKGILIQNVFIMDESTQFIEAFIRQSTKYADISDAIRKKRDLPLSEVTAKSYENMDIEQLLETIEILESKLDEELDIDTINLLMNLYQKAVEYFSALNDETYSIFMEKLHVLLTREDIQIVLKSGEPMPPSQKVQSPGTQSPQKKPQAQKQESAAVQPVAQVQEVKKEEAPQPVAEQKVQEVEPPVQKKEEPKPAEEKPAQKEEPKIAEKKEEPVAEPEPVQKEEEKPKEPEPEVKVAEPEQKEEQKAQETAPETKEAEKTEESQSKKSKKKNKKGKQEQEESKPEETKPEEVQEEVKPEEPKVEEQKPEETKPEEVQPVEEQKPEEVQPVEEAKPEEVKPAEEPKAEEPAAEETQPEETQSKKSKKKNKKGKQEEAKPAEEAKVEDTKPEEPQVEEAKPEEIKPEEPKVEEQKPEEVQPAEEPKTEEAQPVEEAKAEETKPVEEAKPEESQEEQKPDEPKQEEQKPEEPKQEEPKAEEPKKEEEETSHANVAIANNDDMFDIGDDDD